MTKADVISAVVAETGIARADVTATIEGFMKVVKKAMIENREDVYLRSFGTFAVKRRAEKLARNISKNTTVIVPAHDYPTFKPSKQFCDEMLDK
ncbi:MAG: integration host factor subunit beta [Bacteroidaceae bacterium]|nr:integration host factor subunit beta [Bacteroidaceae bacterium]